MSSWSSEQPWLNIESQFMDVFINKPNSELCFCCEVYQRLQIVSLDRRLGFVSFLLKHYFVFSFYDKRFCHSVSSSLNRKFAASSCFRRPTESFTRFLQAPFAQVVFKAVSHWTWSNRVSSDAAFTLLFPAFHDRLHVKNMQVIQEMDAMTLRFLNYSKYLILFLFSS